MKELSVGEQRYQAVMAVQHRDQAKAVYSDQLGERQPEEG
jgi:hypothetical protein